MIEAVFISDLHLSPDEHQITQRFFKFTDWAAKSTKSVYILGDFFHAWAGDDAMNEWSLSIAERLAWLSDQGVKIYYLHGNRDFLLGKAFFQASNLKPLPDPYVVEFDNQAVMLTHGDQFCSKDKSHQRFRKLTRNQLFIKLFMQFPLFLREKLVASVRNRSQLNEKPQDNLDIIPETMCSEMNKFDVSTVIHGHIHKPQFQKHLFHNKNYQQYVLSDWDDSVAILCYYVTKGFYFDRGVL